MTLVREDESDRPLNIKKNCFFDSTDVIGYRDSSEKLNVQVGWLILHRGNPAVHKHSASCSAVISGTQCLATKDLTEFPPF